MKTRRILVTSIIMMALFGQRAIGDELRHLKRGEPMPAFRLVTIDGAAVDGASYKDTVLVVVYLSAEQRSSELAAMDAHAVVTEFTAHAPSEESRDSQAEKEPPSQGSEQVKLLFVTADVVQKAYFQRFRQERGISAPLALDADRSLYGKLGLIVFPTTVIMNREGKLAHVISIHNPDYKHVLDSSIRHAMDMINDEQLRERLQTRPSSAGSPKSLASSHRALARQLREKGRLGPAREELLKSREQDPSNPEIMLDLADLDVALSNLDDAQSLIETVLSENPGHRRAKQIKGIILFRRDRLEEAEQVLLEALNLNPEPARIHYYLGRIYEQQGQTAKALDQYRRSLQRLLDEQESPS